jgi:microcystin-dependent protein
MLDAPIGTIATFGFPFAPKDWIQCNGQTLAKRNFPALYALIKDSYLPQGATPDPNTFYLPNLRQTVAVCAGTARGIEYPLGKTSGQNVLFMTTDVMPAHTHNVAESLQAVTNRGVSNNPMNNVMGSAGTNIYLDSSDGSYLQSKGQVTVADTGVDTPAPLSINRPYTAVNICIRIEASM